MSSNWFAPVLWLILKNLVVDSTKYVLTVINYEFLSYDCLIKLIKWLATLIDLKNVFPICLSQCKANK